MSDPQVQSRTIARFADGAFRDSDDIIAIERALEIHIGGRSLAVTLRTPGHDRELALGFLAGEGLIARRDQIAELCEIAADCADRPDRIEVTLSRGVVFDWTRMERHFAASAACGLCGRAHLESMRAGITPIDPGPSIDPAPLIALPEVLRASQVSFATTGGIHAAAYCDRSLAPLVLREDVGRHNAVDKVVGWLFDHDRFPADGGVLWVSGRAGAEIVLKAARARIPVLAAVGAPSSLAIELAEAAAMTLIGFLRDGRMNVYCGRERIRA